MVNKQYAIGIDMHGTLLDCEEEIPKKFHKALRLAIQRVKPFASIYTCTGNDLLFVKERLRGLLGLFDGHILETGCVISLNGKTEQVLVKEEELKAIKMLKKKIDRRRFSWVTEGNRRRLATISLFTNNPKSHMPDVQAFVNSVGFGNIISVVHSSVAVDLKPKGYDKYTGLRFVAKGKNTIGIADSQNDSPLILHSDFAFVPENVDPELVDLVESNGKRVVNISNAKGLKRNQVIKASKKEVEGVIQILNFISDYLEGEM
jgi:hydroxymethylpyrimidine pyrophosphatase-like HAD family hydrolase